MFDRNAGLLLHISSLPGPYGIGDLGPEAFKFVDFLQESGQSIWQVLPVGPTGYGYSPYQSPSTFAGNDLFISPELLRDERLVTDAEIQQSHCGSPGRVAYDEVIPRKRALMEAAFARFSRGESSIDVADYNRFEQEHRSWLSDYSLFAAIKKAHSNRSWIDWPDALRDREPDTLHAVQNQLAHQISLERFVQYLFFRQWQRLKSYANDRGISVVGDLPIYVAHDSADVWANPHLFHLDHTGNPTVVAGVPPDYFSETGQRWGNPIYRWDKMQETGFAWWTERVRRILEMVDVVRLDHFRAFEAYWSVPAHEQTAVNGEWVAGPGQHFFDVLQHKLGRMPLIAEDLGVITDEVVKLIEDNGFPGMAILQFAFDSGPTNKFLPHNYDRNIVAYTGTHDNDTIAGWLSGNRSTVCEDVAAQTREYAKRYLAESRNEELPWAFIRALYASVANTVIIPIQDLLGIGEDGRMNEPGTAAGNWTWRMSPGVLNQEVGLSLKSLADTFGR